VASPVDVVAAQVKVVDGRELVEEKLRGPNNLLGARLDRQVGLGMVENLSKKNFEDPTICSVPGWTARWDSEWLALKLFGLGPTHPPATGGFSG
jgi:hypothetical protein